MTTDPIIETLPVNNVIYYLPATEDDVIFLVNKAQQEKKVVCLRGAAHSRPLISMLEGEVDAGRLYLLLSKMMAVTFDDALQQVTVQGGCHLGYDPSDPLATAAGDEAKYQSTVENSLLYQLDQHRPNPSNPLVGWGLPDLGGIIHQTVGGFLSTGSSGSNLHESFNEQLVSLTIITGGADGARRQVFSKNDPNYPDMTENPFYAAGVALGLFGVIVSATFQCMDAFDISGFESTTTIADCPIDLFGDKPELISLPDFFKTHRYKRMMWWPQEGVEKMVVWQAEPMAIKEGFRAVQYQEVPVLDIFGYKTPIPAEIAANLMMRGFSGLHDYIQSLKETHPIIYKILGELDEKELTPLLLNCFVPVNPVVDGKQVPPAFQDVWYSGIPMDNRISDILIPVWFTELWFPIDQGPVVLSTLRKFFANNDSRVGSFSYEIYPAKASEFWLSAAYHTDVFRIDMFWFGDNIGSPLTDFYPELWDELYKNNLYFRPHWGKFLPAGDSREGASYLQARYPNFDKWKALREQMDPLQVFVSDYWRSHLDIKPLVA